MPPADRAQQALPGGTPRFLSVSATVVPLFMKAAFTYIIGKRERIVARIRKFFEKKGRRSPAGPLPLIPQ
ncbi:hypothetical protein K430107D3_15010 [Dysosmobacter welbionis]